MKPKNDRIQINLLSDLQEVSGIVAPEDSKNARKAEVVAVGEDVEEIKAGDKVFLKRFKPVRIGTQEFLFTRESNILAKYE